METLFSDCSDTDGAMVIADLVQLVVEFTCTGKPDEGIELSSSALGGLSYVLQVAEGALRTGVLQQTYDKRFFELREKTLLKRLAADRRQPSEEERESRMPTDCQIPCKHHDLCSEDTDPEEATIRAIAHGAESEARLASMEKRLKVIEEGLG